MAKKKKTAKKTAKKTTAKTTGKTATRKTGKKAGAKPAGKGKYRALTRSEIKTLKAAGCTAEDWKSITVANGFTAKSIRNTCFSGKIKLGEFSKPVTLPGGIKLASGIYNACLHNCSVGSNTLIRNVGQHIANYNISTNAVIDNIDCLVVEGETTFGNGTEVEALNEGGGREVKIYDNLSSQVAYILALYRDQPRVIEAVEKMIDAYVDSVKSRRGTIGKGARIVNCGALTDIRVGPAAVVDGALKLTNGTINSEPAAPALIGEGVIAEDFITCAGSKVTGGAVITATFVGQGAKVGRQYSAENVLLFANCEAFHGEGVAVFGGPYTVTHHKSTLLIAGLFSFYNAGSGSNQSNHMYKLGPVHQGILERGSKTGSFSYMLWSCHVGAFTAVIGKHYSKFDAQDLPFSYIMESGGKSVLIPAFNFFTVGTRRDGAKWPKRDRRETENKLDLINFDVLSPYTVGKMINGRKLLRELEASCDADKSSVDFQGVNIPRKRLARGADSYDAGIKMYLGGKIVERIEAMGKKAGDIPALLATSTTGSGKWLDICGLLTPASEVDTLLKAIGSGRISSIGQLQASLRELYEAYTENEWRWVVDTWLQEIGKSSEQVTAGDLAAAIRDWQDAATKCNDLILKDAHKEFGADVKIGFGLDGDKDAVEADFAAIRGTFDENSFVRELREDSEAIKARAEKALSALGVK